MNADKSKNFNRSINYLLDFKKKEFNLNILFNKHNTYTAYHIDKSSFNHLKNKNSINVCFDLRKSNFCNTFLDICDMDTDNCNLKSTFNGIFTQHKDILYYDVKETIILDKVIQGDSFIENKLDINILKLYKFPNDFLFCILNRQCVNEKYRKRIVRSSYFSLYSRNVSHYLISLIKKFKSNGPQYQNTKDAMESLFSNDLTPQQIQNGFQL